MKHGAHWIKKYVLDMTVARTTINHETGLNIEHQTISGGPRIFERGLLFNSCNFSSSTKNFGTKKVINLYDPFSSHSNLAFSQIVNVTVLLESLDLTAQLDYLNFDNHMFQRGFWLKLPKPF